MPSYDLESPMFLSLLVIYFLTFSIRAYDIGILHSIREGNIVRPLGTWVGGVHWIGWGSAIALLILNWKYALIVFVIRFFLRLFGVLQIVGFLILYPFIKKVPEGVSKEHLAVAKAMFVLCERSLFFGDRKPSYFGRKQSIDDHSERFEYAMVKLAALEIKDDTEENILKALDYLRADDFVKSEARIQLREEEERREVEQKRLKAEKEWEKKEQQWDEERRKSDEDFEKMMKDL